MRRLRKSFILLLTVACLVATMFTSAFAASSPTWGVKAKDSKGTGTYWAKSTSSKIAVKKKTASKKTKVDTVSAKVTLNGKTYKVTNIGKNTYKGCTKLTQININSKYLTYVNKLAFNGLSKKQLSKIKVVVTKKMSKANYKKLRKRLISLGISAKNISRQ